MTKNPSNSLTPENKPVPEGRIIRLDLGLRQDLEFVREVFGYEAENAGWVREQNRLYLFSAALTEAQARRQLEGPAPPSVLDPPEPPLPEGSPSRHLMTMEDGTGVTWISHPRAIPEKCRPHWRKHTSLFVIEGRDPDFTAHTSIYSYAFLEGADGKFRFFGPGGIRWIDYPDKEAALSDALDMSLAVAMKVQVVRTPNGGNKISIFGDIRHKPRILRSVFQVFERMGFIVTSADLGLSIQDLREYAWPVAPTTVVPLGVYKKGIPSALVTADAAFAGVKAMAESLPGFPALNGLTVSIQGLGEVGYRSAQHLLEAGARVVMAEIDPETCEAFQADNREAFSKERALILDDPESIYDVPADMFFPCALRDILTAKNLGRLKGAGVKIVGGPANNLFPDQVSGPWLYHQAGLPVVPYEGIGAGGVTGVAYSIMSGILDRCPFSLEEKTGLIRQYVAKNLAWSERYDLPPQVVSDRILFRSAQRRRVLGQRKSDELLEILRSAYNQSSRSREKDIVDDFTKRGFFHGPGRFPDGGWRYAENF